MRYNIYIALLVNPNYYALNLYKCCTLRLLNPPLLVLSTIQSMWIHFLTDRTLFFGFCIRYCLRKVTLYKMKSYKH